MNYTDPHFIKSTFNKLIWDGKYNHEPNKQYKISIVQTCMGRCHDLKQTLPYNLRNNPSSEFVIINYNSKDDLDEYIRTEYLDHIESGKLNYYKTIEPQHYSMSHSRNIGFRVAKGDIVASVDADNFLGDPKIESCFEAELNILANQSTTSFFGKGVKMCHGSLAFFKHHFESLGGYDESFGNLYGNEDRDIMLRSFVKGLTFYYYGGKFCFRRNTSKKEKVANHKIKNIKESEEITRLILNKNFESRIIRVNPNGYGKARLIKNFKEEVVLE